MIQKPLAQSYKSDLFKVTGTIQQNPEKLAGLTQSLKDMLGAGSASTVRVVAD